MAAIGDFLHRLSRNLRSEDGIAVPTALMALIASFALASVAVLSSVNVQQGSHRDQGSKNAIAAADAGASVALLRLNRYQEYLSTTECVGPSGEVQSASGGWCPATPPATVGSSTYSYQVSSYSPGKELTVVGTGTSGGVTRRVEVGLTSVNGKEVFADEHLIGQDDIEVKGNVDIETDIGTNGKIEKEGNSANVCGDIRTGPGKGPTWNPNCGKEKTEGERNLPPIVPPTDISTNNSNCRLAASCTPATQLDTFLKNGKEKRTSTEPWDPKTQTINVPSNSAFTMGGADYYICGLYVKGELIMAATSHIRIFIRKPEECGMAPGATQFEVTAGAVVKSSAYIPSEGKFEVPNIYLLGSGAARLLGNSGTDELILYAPYSEIEIGGGATWIGLIAGKHLNLHGNPLIKSDPGLSEPDLTLKGLWQRTHYVECTGSSVSPPNASC
jgi:hypothetical protein